jgi:AcrR family transcriptional regulator
VQANQARTTSVRGAPVTDAIFEATFEELARVGYGGLNRELVAARAGVNKSTVYRRWPTTLALVEAAFASARYEIAPGVPNTSTLRGDLVALVLEAGLVGKSPPGRAALRVFLFEAQTPDLASVGAALGAEEEARGPKLIVDRAIGRGELPPGTDRSFLVDTVRGAVLWTTLLGHRRIDAAYAGELVDTVLHGVLAAAGGRAKKPAKKKASRR